MRDWNVRKPTADYVPGSIDWSAPEPPRPPHPDHWETPWGEVFHRGADGLYRVRPSDAPLSFPALEDKIDRFLLRWAVLRPGVAYHVHGARAAVLWRNVGGTYRAGHVALSGPLGGVWLVERETFRRAATRAELWWLGMGPMRHLPITTEAMAQRLRVALG